MTQTELARALGISQQAMFAYETGGRRISMVILMKLSRVFDLTLDELAGMEHTARRPRGRLSPRALRHAHRLQMLPSAQQRFVLRILDQLENANKKQRAQVSGRQRLVRGKSSVTNRFAVSEDGSR